MQEQERSPGLFILIAGMVLGLIEGTVFWLIFLYFMRN